MCAGAYSKTSRACGEYALVILHWGLLGEKLAEAYKHSMCVQHHHTGAHSDTGRACGENALDCF